MGFAMLHWDILRSMLTPLRPMLSGSGAGPEMSTSFIDWCQLGSQHQQAWAPENPRLSRPQCQRCERTLFFVGEMPIPESESIFVPTLLDITSWHSQSSSAHTPPCWPNHWFWLVVAPCQRGDLRHGLPQNQTQLELK